jgi:hypothetical protein
VAPVRGALDRQLQQAPHYDHRVDAAGVARLLRLGVRRLALAFWLLVRDHTWLSRGRGARCLPVRR